MSKRNGASEKAITKWVMDWDDLAIGKDYCPFLYVRDVPSQGDSYIIKGLNSGRHHHFLSELEYFHFLLLEFDQSVTDIREQYALIPRSDTAQIADSLGFRHPAFPQSKLHIVMTTDFLVTKKVGDITWFEAISVKPSSAMDSTSRKYKRTMEKQNIESEFWFSKNIPWHISTENDISLTRARNLRNLWVSMAAEELNYLNLLVADFIQVFQSEWSHNIKLIELLRIIGVKIGLSDYESKMAFGKAVWLHLLDVDLDTYVIKDYFPVSFNQGEIHD